MLTYKSTKSEKGRLTLASAEHTLERNHIFSSGYLTQYKSYDV